MLKTVLLNNTYIHKYIIFTFYTNLKNLFKLKLHHLYLFINYEKGLENSSNIFYLMFCNV